MKLRTMIFSVASIACALPAFAQEAPGFLSGIPNISYEGQIAGMDVWVSPDQGLYLASPDGKTILSGTVYTSSGRDIGSAFIGTAPKVPGNVVATADDEPVRAHTAAPESPATSFATDPTAVPLRSAGQETCMTAVADMSEILGFPDLEEDPVKEVMPLPHATPPNLETAGLGGFAPEDVTTSAQEALDGFSDAEKQVILLNLVNRLQAAKTQDAFVTAVVDWRIEINQRRLSKGMPKFFSDDGMSILSSSFVPTSEPEQHIMPAQMFENEVTPSTMALSVDDIPEPTLAHAGHEDPNQELAAKLLTDVRENGFWFGLGDSNAKTVYAFIDPTCPYCAAAINYLSDRIGDREIELRVLLVPAVSDRAPDVIAGILTADNPLTTFFDHEIELHKFGRSSLQPKPFKQLDERFRRGVIHNYETVREYGIPGVPFFVFDTKDGPQAVSGDPGNLDFDAILVDTYKGQ